jgi:NAD+ kinase
MIKRLGLMGNLNKKGLIPLCKRIMGWCRRRDVTVYAEKELYNAITGKGANLKSGSLDSCDLVCLMGGDGYLLNASRLLHPSPVPILPINLGSLGFHTQIDPDEILASLNRFHKKSIPLIPRYLLEVTPSPKRKDVQSVIAFNDVLIVKETQSRLIHVEVFVEGVFLGKVPCDGMVVSSATGSTAYNLSTGGPLVHPNLDVSILFSICAHTLSMRPLVIPGKSLIKLRYQILKDREEAKACVDGQIWWDLRPGDSIEISTSPSPLFIAEANPGVFYRKVNSVIQWGASLITRNPQGV